MRRALVGLLLGLVLAGAAVPDALASQGDITIPKTLNNLPLTKEKAGPAVQQVGLSRAAIDRLDMYSVRLSGNQLAATLEVAHFRSSAGNYRSASFQRDVAGQIGSSVTQALEVGHSLVYMTTGRGINIAIWFRGAYLLILVIRTDYGHPKDLLRSAVESLQA